MDANLECWESDYNLERVMKFVERKTVSTTNHDFKGRIGLYVPTATTTGTTDDARTDTDTCEREELITDFWRSYHNSESVMDIFKFLNQTKLAQKSVEWSDNCDPAQFGCPEGSGKWTSPQCAGGAPCNPIFHTFPKFAVGWGEQVVSNLNLNFSFFYAGWDLFDFVDTAVSEGQPVMFLLWRPHEFLASNKYTRVAFPESNAVCAILLSHYCRTRARQCY